MVFLFLVSGKSDKEHCSECSEMSVQLLERSGLTCYSWIERGHFYDVMVFSFPNRRYRTGRRSDIAIPAVHPAIRIWAWGCGGSFDKVWAVEWHAGHIFFANVSFRRWAQFVVTSSNIKKIIVGPVVSARRASASKVSIIWYDIFTIWRSFMFRCWEEVRQRAKLFVLSDIAASYMPVIDFCCKKYGGTRQVSTLCCWEWGLVFSSFCTIFGTCWFMSKVLRVFLTNQ